MAFDCLLSPLGVGLCGGRVGMGDVCIWDAVLRRGEHTRHRLGSGSFFLEIVIGGLRRCAVGCAVDGESEVGEKSKGVGVEGVVGAVDVLRPT